MNRIKIVSAFLWIFCPIVISAAVIHVPGDEPTIQTGINAASNGDIVLVADGTYTGLGNRDLSFGGKAITVRSVNGPEQCIIDCEGRIEDPHRAFIFNQGEGEQAVVQGFTIRNGHVGKTSETQSSEGGGINCRNASPTIMNNIFTQNVAGYRGGGICCDHSKSIISNNTFTQNSARKYGGGIYCTGDESPFISGNLFEGNLADGLGGGICCRYGIVTVINNTFQGNSSGGGGGGIYCDGSSVVRNNVITMNTAIYGAGIVCRNKTLVRDNMVTENVAIYEGGGIYCSDYASPTIMANTVISNTAGHSGGGISVVSDAKIIHNEISQNDARVQGGGIYCYIRSETTISLNTINGNSASEGAGIFCYYSSVSDISGNIITSNIGEEGGGIHCLKASAIITNNRISQNAATLGGGIYCYYECAMTIMNNLITQNTAEADGGGIFYSRDISVLMASNTLTGNTAGGQGGGIYCKNSALSILNAICWADLPDEIHVAEGEAPLVSYSDIDGGYPGEGNIDNDPLFMAGQDGDFYLSHQAAGQEHDSPCIDAGNDLAENICFQTVHGTQCMDQFTTRTDLIADGGQVDLGYHYAFPLTALVVGPGPRYDNPPLIRLFPPEQDPEINTEFYAYGVHHYGVNVSCGDVNGDGSFEIITGPGPGEFLGPHVRGYDAEGGLIPGLNFLAYGTHRYGVNVASGDIDGDGRDEIITGAGPCGVFGPHVRAFRYDALNNWIFPVSDVNFLAYNFHHWGVNIAGGDLDLDGYDEIITGPGPDLMFGPHARGWDIDGGASAAMTAVDFFAYGTSRYGLVVSSGDVDGDGADELITAPGPSCFFGAHVRGWNYDEACISPLTGCSFFAYPSSEVRYGGRVYARVDLDANGYDELITGPGPDPSISSAVKVFRYTNDSVVPWFYLQAFPSNWTHGVSVAAGQLDLSFRQITKKK